MRRGRPPSGTVAVTASSRGSTRETVASSGSSTHSPDGPAAMTAGASPTRVVLVSVPVRASIRARVPEPSVATHTAPSAAARPLGSPPVLVMLLVRAGGGIDPQHRPVAPARRPTGCPR